MDTASIIICTYNKPDFLLATLASFNKIKYNRDKFEVIVCDDGSCNKILDNQLSQFDYSLTYLHMPHRGRSSSRNDGIMRSHGDIIIFNDDDTIVGEDFVSKHVEWHQKNKDVMVLGHRKQIYIEQKNLKEIWIDYSNNVDEFIRESRDDVYSACIKPKMYFKSILSPHWICSTTGNMSVEKKWLKKYGLFDPNFNGWGFEDIELGYRYSKHGLVFLYDSNLINYHIEHPRDRGNLITEMTSNIRYFYEKYNKAEDISLFWDFFRGVISLEDFDKKTFNVLNAQTEKTIFPLFVRSCLPALEEKHERS